MNTDVSVPEHVLDAFGVPGAAIEPLTGGRTNRTMRVRNGRDLVLQHLRSTGPADVLGIMENLVRVTSHLEWKRATGDARDQASWWPLLVPTTAERPFLMDERGDVWRAFVYRQGRIARTAQPPEVLESAAALFGRFSRATLDLEGPELVVTTPGFHDLDPVWHAFETEIDAASSDPERRHRVDALADDVAAVRATRRVIEERSSHDGLAGLRPRVVHNDTKISNALLHVDRPRAIAVLDLDLVMMGPLWHDVGDLLRSVAWHRGEHPPALDAESAAKVLRAFVEGAAEGVSDDEIATFATAGPRISFELGVRYLTDHLRSEPHLRVEGVHGHWRRGVANVKLATEMLNAYDALRFAVDQLVDRR